ncbi:hypothetical protein GGR38_004038 [Novosphingobium sediminicola]|uniref:Toprim domain-containing protein n=2 Tax=Novosphingobium sediminicola TaxID=563162 RepID=A0A7W6CLX8_9SPHN|nr:hypothetical protein [Novosphingobium sediminicola]
MENSGSKRPRPAGTDLEVLGAGLVRGLGGMWQGKQGMCLCPAHDDREPSLSVRIGKYALLFKCFAGCDRREVIRAIRLRDRDALMRGRGGPEREFRHALPGSTDPVRRLWDCARPLAGTRAEAYLRRRGLGTNPPALRYLSRTPLGCGRDVVFRPAMIAAVHQGSKLVAVQRTFLAPDRPIRARDLSNPRRMLGRPLAGAVQLAPAGDILGLAEGTETAMSAMALLGIGVWATLGAGRLHRVALPAGISRLVLLPDNDHAGQAGAAKALETYRMQGRIIEVLWPPAGCKDWNDALRKGEKGVVKIGDGQPEWTGCDARRP